MMEYNDPNATLDYTYDSDEVEARIQAEAQAKQEEAARLKAEAEAETKQPEVKEEAPEVEQDFLQGVADMAGPGIGEQVNEQGQFNTDTMGGRQRVVAGTVDLAMDTLSAIIPALKPADEWWEEKSGRNVGDDPFKKAERDIGGMMVGTIIGGGLVGKAAQAIPGAANLSARTKFFGQFAADLGVDALLSGVSDTTSEQGNMANIAEKILPNGVMIPWAGRDSDSPDVTKAKNMLDNMLLGTVAGGVTAMFGGAQRAIIKPKNDRAAQILAIKELDEAEVLAEAGGDPTIAASMRFQRMKQKAQIEEGQKALALDPEGEQGYNAFVNEPAEPVARITLDEEANPLDFMADQARIQNNVDTFDGASRPIINNSDIERLASNDAINRDAVLKNVEQGLEAEFDIKVDDQSLNSAEIQQSINNLYDAAMGSEESFADAVKSMRNTQIELFSNIEKFSDANQQEALLGAARRLVDAVSPYKLRASAAVQTQAAGSVSDISRNIDLMSDVVDTTRLQELVLPRLKVLLREAETSKVAIAASQRLKAKVANKVKTLDGALDLDMDDIYAEYDAAFVKARDKVDNFVDNLGNLSKQNPAFLRPIYRMWAKTNGNIDTLYKMNKYLDNKLGMLNKAVVDLNPEVPSVILRELNGVVMGNLLNGLAPAKAWVGNAMSLMVKPATVFAGSVPSALKGDLKPIQRAWYSFSGGLETFDRARKYALDELRFANQNPDAAMARGRKDYNKSDMANPGSNDPAKYLSDFEEMEELSETWSLGKQALWNLTKTTASWNRKSWNRWGIHQMYAADGFAKSIMASANSRAKAFDQLSQTNNGNFTKADFQKIERDIYNQTFDEQGVLKEGYAKFMSEEMALNADVPLVEGFQKVMDHIPILKSIMRFPTTRLNQFSLVQTFDPTGVLGGWMDRSMKTMRAQTPEQIADVLSDHGMTGASLEDFQALKSEYIGRKMMTSGVVMTAAIAAASGRLMGTGPSDPAENKKWRDLGGQPFSIDIGTDDNPNVVSYEALPAWIKLPLSLTADITREFTDVDGDIAEGWYRTIAASLNANVTNDLFGNEIETLSGLLSLKGQDWQRYAASQIDSLILGTGVRGALSSILVPNLQDVENNWYNYLANRNRWIPSIDAKLSDQVDVFTGKPLNEGSSPIEMALGKALPGFSTKADNEPWRRWLLSTGWSGLSKPTINKLTGKELTPPQRQWINNWIGNNLNLDEKVVELMEWDDGKWNKALKNYTKTKGFRSQKDFPAKELFVHEYMDRMMSDAYKKAWTAYTEQNETLAGVIPLQEARDRAISQGNMGKAAQLADQVKILEQQPVK